MEPHWSEILAESSPCLPALSALPDLKENDIGTLPQTPQIRHQCVGRPDGGASYQTAPATGLHSFQAAVSALKEFDNGEILAWLKMIRSVAPGYTHSSSTTWLSNRHLDAIACLMECQDSDILAWLTQSRSGGIVVCPCRIQS